ncbi:S1 family peptidase [Marichromatium bheemlicum]|uniref:Trypsin-like peptidase domain-containing protein n=1 Tax=Marichromatium bheemlicum TaxID=365339 RepID=A0ABX1I8U2_9GAMM|nr:serine protease [Marichromatium bheemlicum]NKN33364.1 trypsin-like peptidase domain-containing protein [Marichromatium bheemlicum]
MHAPLRVRPAPLILAVTLLVLHPLLPVSPTSASTLVNCYDAEREMVVRTRQQDCQGRAVSDAEAAQIRARRRAYVRDSLEVNSTPRVLGRRLERIGAGFFVDPAGHLLTNAHVVHDCTTVTVSRDHGEMAPARAIAVDTGADLALLATDYRPERSAPFMPIDDPLPETVAIIGYPNQGLPPLRPLLTTGSIAPTRLITTPARTITLNADIRPGNSGGPVLDVTGRVVGVVFAAVDTPSVYERTGRVVRDIGVSIPNTVTLPFLARHGIDAQTDQPATPPDDMLEYTSAFIARVECWR